MPLLGELLVDDGFITSEQRDHALAIQARMGLRFGSALVELGYLDADTVAKGLSAQLGIPAVLQKHFAAMDASAARIFTPRQAEKYKALPLGYTGAAPKRIVVAFVDPQPTLIEEIAFIAGKRVEAGIASETVIRRELARVYGIADERPRMISVALEEPPPTKKVVRAKASERPRIKSLSAPPPPRAKSVRPAHQPSRSGGGDRKKPSVAPPSEPVATTRPALPLDDALAAMGTARSSEAVADLLVDYLRSSFGCGLVLLCKDDLALGWKGFASGADEDAIEAISLPLSSPSMLKVAHESQTLFRGAPPTDGAMLHKRLYKLLRCDAPREVIVAPIVLGRRVVNLVYAHAMDGGVVVPKAPADLLRACVAVADAYTRIIRKR